MDDNFCYASLCVLFLLFICFLPTLAFPGDSLSRWPRRHGGGREQTIVGVRFMGLGAPAGERMHTPV